MQKVKNLLKEQKIFLSLYFLLFAFSSTFLFSFSKAQLHIYTNQHYNSFFDHFFYYITNLGDGITCLTIGILLLFYSIRSSCQVIITYAASGIIVQILKRLFFSGTPRPKAYFEGLYDLRFVQGLEIHTNNSFPSGHAASAFALFLSLSIIIKNKYLQVLFLVLAASTAFSRVYLSQHFLIDITFGSLISVLTTMTYYYLQSNWKALWLDTKVNDYIGKRKKDSIDISNKS